MLSPLSSPLILNIISPETPPLDSSTWALPSANTYIDPFLGYSTTLWPWLRLLGIASDLSRQLSEARMAEPLSSLTIALQVQCVDAVKVVYTGLTSWTPPQTYVSFQVGSDNGQAVSCSPLTKACMHTALAYRHSAMVFLHQATHGSLPDALEVQEHVKLALMHCEATITSGGPVTGLLWPLFTAACDARTSRDKAAVRNMFTELQRRSGTANIERAWATVICIWSASKSNAPRWTLGSRTELMMAAEMNIILG